MYCHHNIYTYAFFVDCGCTVSLALSVVPRHLFRLLTRIKCFRRLSFRICIRRQFESATGGRGKGMREGVRLLEFETGGGGGHISKLEMCNDV